MGSESGKKRVLLTLGIGALLAMIVSGLLLAQGGGYSLYFLKNPDFDRNLGPWWIAYETREDGRPIERGMADWSPEYGGSAHLAVSGAPSSVDLLDYIGTTIYPEDAIVVRVTHTDLANFGDVAVQLSGGPFAQKVFLPSTAAGTHDIELVADHMYPPGTAVRIHLVVWPGSGEAWIHYVQLQRGGSTGS